MTRFLCDMALILYASTSMYMYFAKTLKQRSFVEGHFAIRYREESTFYYFMYLCGSWHVLSINASLIQSHKCACILCVKSSLTNRYTPAIFNLRINEHSCKNCFSSFIPDVCLSIFILTSIHLSIL